ncbi:MAG: hypothetical protein PHE83_07785 [Opitutaceae bacterium]|nr:hypothetical protein [Opitutaceae bacterium]
MISEFKQHFATTRDNDERRLLTQVLAYLSRDDASFASDLPEPARRAPDDANSRTRRLRSGASRLGCLSLPS